MFKFLSDTFQITAVRRLSSGVVKLTSGNVTASAIGLVSFTLAARSLGVHDYGLLVLISAGIAAVDQLINFQSWQAIIRFGTGLWESGARDKLGGLLRLGFFLDLSTATLAFCLANIILLIAASIFDWSPLLVSAAALYSLTIVFNLSGVPIAVLRMANRYMALAVHASATSFARLVAVSLAAWNVADLEGFVLAWLVGDIFGHVLLFYLGFRAVKMKGVLSVQADDLRTVLKTHPRLIRFLAISNLQSSLRLGTTQLDTLVVGGMLGAASAGLYNVTKKLARLVSIILTPLYQAVYPELARTNSHADAATFGAIVWRSAIVMTCFGVVGWVCFAIVGRQLIEWTVGPEYIEAYVPLLIYLIGVVLSLGSFTFQPAMLSLGMEGAALRILVVATGIYLAMLVLLTEKLDLIGACAAYGVFYAVWVGLMGPRIFTGISRLRSA